MFPPVPISRIVTSVPPSSKCISESIQLPRPEILVKPDLIDGDGKGVRHNGTDVASPNLLPAKQSSEYVPLRGVELLFFPPGLQEARETASSQSEGEFSDEITAVVRVAPRRWGPNAARAMEVSGYAHPMIVGCDDAIKRVFVFDIDLLHFRARPHMRYRSCHSFTK